MSLQQTIYMPLFIISIALFCCSCHQRLRLVFLGRSVNRFDRPLSRLKLLLTYALGQKRVLQNTFGISHALLFWVCWVLVLANVDFLLTGLSASWSLALLPAQLRNPVTLIFDLTSFLALFCVSLVLARRLCVSPEVPPEEQGPARRSEALIAPGMIAAMMLAFFLLHGAQSVLGHDIGQRPISGFIGSLLGVIPVSTVELIAQIAWWVYALVFLLFLNYLPYSRQMHILTAIPNIYLRGLEKPNGQERELFKRGERFGVGEINQFNRKDLLDSLTCTECGRCQQQCPAHNSGKSLNPRRIIHDIRANLLVNGPRLQRGAAVELPLMATEQAEGSCGIDALWCCTTCGACTKACPMLIEQMPKIIQMRRHLVQERAEFPAELRPFFANIENYSNPWGRATDDRGGWRTQSGDRPFKKGISEYLFFVGCAGSFDARSRKTSAAVAAILDQAGLSWGMLGAEELCCGDSVRRLGNEYVFDEMAKQVVEVFSDYGVEKVVTACPHCYNTLKNDYRQYGLELEVIHHSELIRQLIEEGALQPQRQSDPGRVVYHDSCYLGRHNDHYQAPRDLLQTATGRMPDELDRNRDQGFCCGAGGGRIWLEEKEGEQVNRTRVREALEHEPDIICVSCPYCMAMIEAGLKGEQAEEVQVRDVAEVVADALCSDRASSRLSEDRATDDGQVPERI